MRSIKFRAKRIDNGKWIYGYYSVRYYNAIIEYGDNGGIGCDYRKTRTILHYISDIDGNLYLIDEKTLGQCFEINNEEFYEGDYIKANYKTSSTYDIEGYVIMYNGTIQIQLKNNHHYYKVNTSKIPFRKIFKKKIIGNIYDNPELLEVK